VQLAQQESKMKKWIAAAMLSMMMFGQAQAGDNGGWYGALKVGLAIPSTQKLELASPPDTLTADFDTSGGIGFGGEVGYAFTGVRFGFEVSFQQNSAKAVENVKVNNSAVTGADLADVVEFGLTDGSGKGPGAAITVTGGRAEFTADKPKLQQVRVMANLYYDFRAGERWLPYVGAGAGVVGARYKIGEDSTAKALFGWQAMAGIGYRLGSSTTLIAEYKYAGTSKLSEDDEGFKTSLSGLGSHVLSVGIRFGF
jgi:opacity protein-like surface antigen